MVQGWTARREKQLSEWVGPKELEEGSSNSSKAMKGLVRPPDVARMVLFLAAADSRMLNGQVFVVDGGWAHG